MLKEGNRFFQEAPPQQSPGIEGVRPVTGVLISEASPIVLPGHSGEGEKQQQPSSSQPLQTSEESSSWYRYVSRTFFNAHSFTTTYRGQNFPFLSELAEHYERPLGSGYCSGVQDRVSGIPSPVLHSQHACIGGGEGLNRPGSSLSLQQKHAIHKVLEPNGPEPSQFISALFTVPKKGGGHRPVVNLKDLNQFVEYQHFKMEGVPMLKDLLMTNDFLSKIDLIKGCLPYCPHMDPSPKIPAFHLAGVRMSAFRASQCTPHVLEATKTSCRPGKKNGNQTNYLPRRHAHYGSIQRLSHRTHYHRSQPVIQPRFRDKRREVCISTYSGTRVPRVSGKFSRNVFVPPTGQGKEYQEGLSVCDKQPFCANQNTLSTSRKTVLFDTSSLPSTPTLPLSSDGQNNGFEESGSSRRAPVVERSLSCFERQIPPETERPIC